MDELMKNESFDHPSHHPPTDISKSLSERRSGLSLSLEVRSPTCWEGCGGWLTCGTRATACGMGVSRVVLGSDMCRTYARRSKASGLQGVRTRVYWWWDFISISCIWMVYKNAHLEWEIYPYVVPSCWSGWLMRATALPVAEVPGKSSPCRALYVAKWIRNLKKKNNETE